MNKILTEIAKFQKQPAFRREAGVFLAEGPKMVSEAPEEAVRTIVMTERFREENEGFEKRFPKDRTGIVIASEEEFSRISDTKTPQGVLAVVRRFAYTFDEVVRDPDGVYVLLDSVQDPGNVGTIFRSAEAAGASGILLNRTSAEVYNPKVVRSTMGAVFRLPFLVTENMEEAVKLLQKRGIRVFAAHLKGSVPYDEADYTGGSAILLGNESKGLGDEISALSDERVRIPMHGKTESLNVAMAATILLYEALRQRKV